MIAVRYNYRGAEGLRVQLDGYSVMARPVVAPHVEIAFRFQTFIGRAG